MPPPRMAELEGLLAFAGAAASRRHGAGKWDGGIPRKRACDKGFYTAVILDVTAPPGTNTIWDGVTPENEIFLDPKPQ